MCRTLTTIIIHILILRFYGTHGCFASRERTSSPTNYNYYAARQQASARGVPNLEPLRPIGHTQAQTSINNNGVADQTLLGRVGVREFSSNGYNAEGGGPVSNGAGLRCDFEGKPCCWANVPSPDDQIDWVVISGPPNSALLRNVSINGNYLAAYSIGAAPSDEAQISSCAIACASSPIRVRARHWQSANVLLQVCQRESFPSTINFNPLLNCQEFPVTSKGIAYTELILPKANLVDIVFVASNFVSENGDVALLDDIQIDYENDPAECEATSTTPSWSSSKSANQQKSSISQQQVSSNSIQQAKSPKQTSGFGGIKVVKSQGKGKAREDESLAAGIRRSNGGVSDSFVVNENNKESIDDGTETAEIVDGGRNGGVDGRTSSSSSSSAAAINSILENKESGNINGEKAGSSTGTVRAHGVDLAKINSVSGIGRSSSSSTSSKSSLSSSSSSSVFTSGSSSSSAGREVISSTQACNAVKCSFENQTSPTCGYSNVYEDQTDPGRGLTTMFHVVKGQFMNRVTGVKEGTEGNYYAAVFLYPREKAGLAADVGGRLPDDQRVRFQYYEGTHGVQLKGCCNTDDDCPFSSNKFVAVTDRVWKWGSFPCPRDTQKILFLCENTRTNQGACAIDDIQVVQNNQQVSVQDKPLC